MKLLWLCAKQPGVISTHITGIPQSAANWVDHVLSDLRKQGVEIRVLCQGAGQRGRLDEGCSYATYRQGTPHIYDRELEPFFRKELQDFSPDVIHIWGTEYSYSLAMANACEQEGMLSRTVVSIQGLCGPYARHYSEGLPESTRRSFTLRDVLRWDNIALQQRKFVLRGEMERQTLEKVPYAIGRTDWDRACALEINPNIRYRFCNETLREEFYTGQWSYDCCRKHRIFASNRLYPVKGFHYLLEALAQVKKKYPDAAVSVVGPDLLNGKDWLHIDGYELYLKKLARKYHLEDSLKFLGYLSAEQMKQAFLDANVFCLPSTIENSPNSLGEAMLLGVPCIASDVGGVANLMSHGTEGFVYQSTAPYMLSAYIQQVFAMEEEAAELGAAAHRHAARTHDPKINLEQLLAIYREITET